MELARDYYRAFEDVVGPEHISIDPAVQEGYAFQPFIGASLGKRFFLSPAAVILPGCTKEVQAVVKLCNRFGLKFKAFGTGYGLQGAAGSEDTVIMDLRRMNRILDIDEKNMTAVVEPYVNFAQLMGEVMKLGLAINVLGAGCNCSVVASYTSMHGNNVLSVSQGYSGRNLLGVEWVLPTGEITRLGATGSGCGWFSGDGPGPSLRGIMRGALGAEGSLGVFTKCAAHLHPWFGPSVLEIKGNSPYYEAVIPPEFEYHICEFPTWEQFAEAMTKVGAAGIAFGLQKTGGPGSVGHCVTGNNNEYYAKRSKGELAVPRKSFCIVTQAATHEEHNWQVKTLDKILEETGGKIAAVGEDPLFRNRDFLTVVKSCFIPRLAFRPTGTFGVDGFLGMESADHMAMGLTMDEQHHDKWTGKGYIMDDGDINNWAVTYEGSHLALFECGHQFSSIDMDSVNGYARMSAEGMDIACKTPFAFNWSFFPAVMVGPLCCNFQDWMLKVKMTFDPNTAADPTNYINPEKK
jgi:glycolate oxidase